MFQLFKRLKHEVPKYYHKVSGVAGDCSLPGLGLSVSSRNTLINEVNIIFHGAATVRFDEHIRVAMNINVSGTRELLNLARKITNLKVIVFLNLYVIYKYILLVFIFKNVKLNFIQLYTCTLDHYTVFLYLYFTDFHNI